MSHALSRIWIHAIWSTKHRKPFIKQNIDKKIYHYIQTQLLELGCSVKTINGMPDHIHCLFLLNRNQSIASVIKQVKGSSSRFINENQLTIEDFSWQVGYAAFSVSESIVEIVKKYIKNQKQNHIKKRRKKG